MDGCAHKIPGLTSRKADVEFRMSFSFAKHEWTSQFNDLVIKQGLFLVGDMAIFLHEYYNFTNISFR